jgi:hypothetical protein
VELYDYDKIGLNIAGADGTYFSACDFYEVEFRVNGRDTYRTSGKIPEGRGSLMPGHTPALILRFTGLDLPK